MKSYYVTVSDEAAEKFEAFKTSLGKNTSNSTAADELMRWSSRVM